jgi:anaerobic selenocysteine-containing dehydrogenase
VVAPLHPSDLGATEVNVEGTAVGGTDVTITGEPYEPDAAGEHAESAAAATAAEAADEDGDAAMAEVETQERASQAAEHEAAAATNREEGDDDDAHVDDTAGDERAEAEAGTEAGAAEDRHPFSKPTPLSFEQRSGRSAPPPVDAYSLRLVTERKLYDRGTLAQHSPAIADLADHAPLRVNPSDFDRLGIADGSQVKVSAAAGSLFVAAVADPGVPRGTAVLAWNQGPPDPAELIDATLAVTDVRVETTP